MEFPQFLQGNADVPRKSLLSITLSELISISAADILVESLYHAEVETVKIPNSQHRESTVVTPNIKMPEPVIYTPGPSSRSSSVFIPVGLSSGEHGINIISNDAYDPPPPMDERIVEIMNERRYRLLLTHGFNPSCEVCL
jgi:hypothetical protein